MLRRYVYAPGEGTPLVWYEGAGTGNKRWLLSDERGSVIAVTDAGGDAIDIRSYDEFGNHHDTTPANGGRFGYTGQQWIAAVGLWDYKARMYSPALGRFLQTDPIGYGDGLNWYNYVGGDPVNATDPTGLGGENECQEGQHFEQFPTGSRIPQCVDNGTSIAGGLSHGSPFSAHGLSGGLFISGSPGSVTSGPLGVTVTARTPDQVNFFGFQGQAGEPQNDGRPRRMLSLQGSGSERTRVVLVCYLLLPRVLYPIMNSSD